MSKINDLDMKNWREYNDIITDSLWIINNRENCGEHRGDYHGNFIPQIPYQMMRRYTKKGDWILDPFLGSGTSLIEAERLKRNGIGIEIDKKALDIAKSRTKKDNTLKIELIEGNSSEVDLKPYLAKNNIEELQFIIYHPPYWNIIEFNDIKGNLALEKTLEDFLNKMEEVFNNTLCYLEKNRYFCVVIGDIYKDSQLIPLNSYIIQMLLNKGYILKSQVIKNMGETRAKSNKKALWRYRALYGGYYIFKHEYILVFRK